MIPTSLGAGECCGSCLPMLRLDQGDAVKKPKYTFYQFADLPLRVLEDIMSQGQKPSPQALGGWEFNGYYTPWHRAPLGKRKFRRVFYSETTNGHGAIYGGYDIKIWQNGLGRDFHKRNLLHDTPARHNWFRIYPVRKEEIDNLYPDALLLNNNSQRNGQLAPSRFLRNYMVQIHPSDPDLFLGKTYVSLGNVRIFLAYFIIERAIRAEQTELQLDS